MKKLKKKYLDEENKIKPIFENVSITDLMEDQYNNSIIIYNQGLDSWDPLDLYNNDTHDQFNILQ